MDKNVKKKGTHWTEWYVEASFIKDRAVGKGRSYEGTMKKCTTTKTRRPRRREKGSWSTRRLETDVPLRGQDGGRESQWARRLRSDGDDQTTSKGYLRDGKVLSGPFSVGQEEALSSWKSV